MDSQNQPVTEIEKALFCPKCQGETITRIYGSGPFVEAGCYLGNEYCSEGNLTTMQCTKDDCLYTFYEEWGIHEGCNCEKNSDCECGIFEKAELLESLDTFTQAYIEALWFTAPALEDDSDNWQQEYDKDDLDLDSLKKIVEDCQDFQSGNEELMEQAFEADMNEAERGHNFALSRNRHGTGFWDRGLPEELGQALHEAAVAFGTQDIMRGKNGVYVA